MTATTMTATTEPDDICADPPESFARRARQSVRTPLGAAALAAVLLLAALAVAGPVVFGDQASRIDTAAMNQGVSGAHLLGTDSLGRDIAARVIVATRLTLRLGLSATAIGLLGGLVLGLAPSVLGRRGGRAVTGVVGVLVAFPGLLFVLFLATIFGIGSTGAVLAIGLALVPPLARLIQNLATTVAGSDYVAAARILGVGRFRIVVRHVLPNIVEPVVLFAAQAATGSLIAFAGLSFLGLGVQSPDYDWGRLLNEGLSRIYVNPASALAPGVAVVLAGLVFGLLGEALAQTAGRRTAARAVPAAHVSAATDTDGALPQTQADVDSSALIQATHLRVSFPGGRTAVRDVSLSVAAGEAVGLVGESGSGKSLTALALAQLVPHPGHVQGTVRFDGHDLLADPRAGRRLGAELAMVFQDPMTRSTRRCGWAAAGRGRPRSTSACPGRPRWPGPPTCWPPSASRTRNAAPGNPHEYSGGMRQRVFIGMGDGRAPADHRRRADHGAGRDRAVAGAGAARPAPGRLRRGAAADLARSGRRRRGLRPGPGDVRRPGRGGAAGGPVVPGRRAPLHPGPGRRDPDDGHRPGPRAGHHPGPAAGAGGAGHGLRVRDAVCLRAGPVPRRAARAGAGRGRRRAPGGLLVPASGRQRHNPR